MKKVSLSALVVSLIVPATGCDQPLDADGAASTRTSALGAEASEEAELAQAAADREELQRERYEARRQAIQASVTSTPSTAATHEAEPCPENTIKWRRTADRTECARVCASDAECGADRRCRLLDVDDPAPVSRPMLASEMGIEEARVIAEHRGRAGAPLFVCDDNAGRLVAQADAMNLPHAADVVAAEMAQQDVADVVAAP